MATKTFTSGSVLTAADVNSYLNNYRADLVSPSELATIAGSAATGTVTCDIANSSVTYYTSNASANFTLNLRGNSTTTASSYMETNEAVTHVFINTNGSPAYFCGTVQIDGTAAGTATIAWQGGAAPTSGNVNSLDAYSLTIIKTAATPSYKLLASQTQFK
jgi:hypothetical protein